LIPRKLRGSLTKLPRLKGYLLIYAVGSGSDGSGAFRFGRSDLNGAVRTVRSGSDGLIWLGVRGRRVCTAVHAGVCMFMRFWAQERWQTVVCMCAVPRQGRTGFGWGRVEL
jgi:hypothetical protein